MKETTNVSIGSQYNLNIGHASVAQKGNVGKKYIYALQLRNQQAETFVLRGTPGSSISNPILHLTGTAAGHTQTWEYSGIANNWFIGVKPNKDLKPWAKQIARINIKTMGVAHSSNTAFPRIAYLNLAGYPEDRCTGAQMKRAEAAVSPKYHNFLIATVEYDGTGHFAIYDMGLINDALTAAGTGFINLGDFQCEESFTIHNLIGASGLMNSIQGYDLDDLGNIYITSQKAPVFDEKTGKYTAHHKEIIKIPWNFRTDTSNWGNVNLSAWKGIDISGKHSEVEGIQILGPDHAYVTVAYHAKSKIKKPTKKDKNYKNKTVLNMIYELSWTF
ncbi:helveticin J family class III bacteriocin [Lactobacillus xylocopicola]|uniref:Bacteriocin n=1 Tax=Lactobacillus xylocopicola TaxID=2976676 RepID=A0ABM8BIF5_9LACO|nr:helveticin J family class III bacteriocin [Lactobacillus xylocopicola]BDR61078.1 bacteriocin [Lactobacillus xylocopicola]